MGCFLPDFYLTAQPLYHRVWISIREVEITSPDHINRNEIALLHGSHADLRGDIAGD